MARRGNPDRYYVRLDNQQMFKIPAARWHQWVAVGLLILVAGTRTVAEPATPGVVWLECGELHVKVEPIAPWMNLNCRVIECHAIYDTRGPKLDPVELQRAIQNQYRGRD